MSSLFLNLFYLVIVTARGIVPFVLFEPSCFDEGSDGVLRADAVLSDVTMTLVVLTVIGPVVPELRSYRLGSSDPHP